VFESSRRPLAGWAGTAIGAGEDPSLDFQIVTLLEWDELTLPATSSPRQRHNTLPRDDR
jgi:hypothetical protein